MRVQKLSLDTLDDYLSEIYRLQESTGLVTTSDVARRLGVSAPTATAMLKKLADEGLVQRERYRGATMTSSGKRRALKTLRRHRLAEKLLVDA
ncbi:MAG: metal-dependent transcriptional regulator, partial [Thermoplasmata archaeon]